MMQRGWIQMNSRRLVLARVVSVAALASTRLVKLSGPSSQAVLASKGNQAMGTQMTYLRSSNNSSLWVVKVPLRLVDHRAKLARLKERTLMYFKLIRHTLLNIQVNIEIDFMEAINGCQKPITYARINKCGTCNGTKMKPGTTEAQCGICDGTGFQTQQFGHAIVQSMCGACNGTGKTFQACISCNGNGTQY